MILHFLALLRFDYLLQFDSALRENKVSVFRTTPTVQIWAQLHLSHQ